MANYKFMVGLLLTHMKGKIMRILFCSAAAILLSGCSWIANTHSHNRYNGYNTQSGTHQRGTSYTTPRLRKPSKLSFTGSLGTEMVVGGHAITGNDGVFNAATRVHHVSMQDAYNLGWRADLGGAYQIGKKNEILINGFYQQASGKDGTIGSDVSGMPLEARLSNYKAFGIETGLRHNIGATKLPLLKTVKPYVEARVGIAKVDDIDLLDVRVAGGAASTNYAYYEGGWVPTVSGLTGFEKPVSKHMSIGLETGLRYIGGISSDDTDVAGSFLQGTNGGSSRWSVPLQIRGRYKF